MKVIAKSRKSYKPKAASGRLLPRPAKRGKLLPPRTEAHAAPRPPPRRPVAAAAPCRGHGGLPPSLLPGSPDGLPQGDFRRPGRRRLAAPRPLLRGRRHAGTGAAGARGDDRNAGDAPAAAF